jgi:endonuclease/exonuclease/phosphatase family metal-dependent hydrolase
VQADTFEIALDRSATPGGASLVQNDSLRLALASGDDRLPERGETVGYVLSGTSLPVEAPTLDNPDSAAVRLMSYNAVNNFDRELNSLFIEDRQPSYRRILGAVGPDVIGFQEVYDQSAERVEATAEGELGLADDWTWAKTGRDLVLGSRFPILDTHAIPGYEDYESGAFLLDSEEALGSRMIVVNMHPPCCNYPANDDQPSSDAQRQRVVDGVAAFVRRVKNGEGPFGVPAETPIVVLGDMNFVGSAQQPRTLRTGEIVNTDDFGPSAAPDWDGTALLDANPRQAHAPMHTTWIDAGSSFPPGRLDYAFVTDSVLDIAHEFVLHTPVLPDDVLRQRGLRAADTETASDHLPVVIDVKAP